MSSVSRLRPSVLAAREQLRASYEQVKRLHASGMASIQTCARHSSTVDTIVSQLYDAALDGVGEKGSQQLRNRVSIVAVGGYGRRQLAPFSDVDLMILYTGKLDTAVKELTQRLTQDLYDVGLHPGHSLRTSSEALSLAKSDAVICTSLIESRLLLGSPPLFDAFRLAFRQMIARRPTQFSRMFIDARAAERYKYGGTVFLLEPNLKRSPGGLRDIHLLRWLWFAKSGESDPDRLLMKGVLSNFDHRRLMSSQSFLLQVRNEMHFGTTTSSDVLSRAEQVRLAESFGFRGREGQLPVEQFMRDYFRHTSHVSFQTTRLCELSSPPTTMTRMLAPMLTQTISRDYRMGPREINATQLGMTKLASKLSEAVRLLDLSRLYDKRIGQETWYHVYRSAPHYSLELEEEAIARFCDMLTNPAKLGETLRKMHELGILEKVIPDFTHARWLLQFNRYHKYTVDEHCLRAVVEVTRFRERHDLLGHTYRKLKRKWLLHLALMLHDLGKGKKRDHSLEGIEIAERIGERLGLDPDSIDLVTGLIRDHLMLADIAFRRDTSDPQFLRQLADSIGNVERLEMLYLLTAADLAAVGPGVLNDWKAEVLGDLFRRLRAHWSDDGYAPGDDQRQLLRKEVWQCLTPAESEDPWFERQYAAMPETFLSTRSPQLVAETLRRCRTLATGQGIAWGRYVADSKTVEFTAGVDQGGARGIFAAMAGVLSSRGMSILAAETALLADGLLLLRYQANDTQSEGPSDETRLDQVAQEMVASIDSTSPPNFRRFWGTENKADNTLTSLPTEVHLDDQLSSEQLLVEVFTFDRIGLLYDLARTLHDMDLSIRHAKIGTYLDQVVDVFYITERDGAKPMSEQRLSGIKEGLMRVLEGG